MADYMQAPRRNALLGVLADAAQSVDDYAQRPDSTMPMGKANALLAVLSRFAGVPAVASTLDRLSYGDSLTTGTGQTLRVRPEVVEAAMTAAPVMQAAGRMTTRGANALADASVRAITRNPQATAQNALAYAAQMRPVTPATVWHGSPHKFDRFDASKIGTGEGAQTYGHGLYLAESPEVAQSYQSVLSGNEFEKIGGLPATVLPRRGLQPPSQMSALTKSLDDITIKQLKDYIAQNREYWNKYTDDYYDVTPTRLAEIRESLNSIGEITPENTILDSGSLYKVDLPDEKIARMLDWDKPLSQQPQSVIDALSKTKNKQLRAMVDYASSPYGFDLLSGEEKTMGEAVKLLGMNTSNAKGSALLNKAGIPGIRYLDGGSRGAGGGTSNFVVFPGEENALTILERNGVPLR